VTPPDLTENWYYDEISERFRRGDVLMVGDWPGFYGLYQKRETCAVFDQFDVAAYPAGPAGIRKSYAGMDTALRFPKLRAIRRQPWHWQNISPAHKCNGMRRVWADIHLCVRKSLKK
jgi:hypothetical protein